MSGIFQTILYQPMFNLFVGLYDIIPDVGLVIVLITVLIKGALFPMTKKSILAQKSMAQLQPKMEALKATYKDDQQKLAQETMKLYKEHKVNPVGSCLPLLVQLPIFLALYWVLRNGLTTTDFSLLYSFVPNPEAINPISLGVFDLSQKSIVLALLAGAAQFWQAKMLTNRRPPKNAGDGAKDESMAAMMNKQMLYMMPLLTVFIGIQFPAGLALYWFLSTLLTALQQVLVFRGQKNDTDDNVVDGKLAS